MGQRFRVSRRGRPVAGFGFSLYERIHFLRGLEATWMDIHEEPEHLHELIDLLVNMNLVAVKKYAEAGVSNILALGGDAPRDLTAYVKANDAFQHAGDLVRFIRKFNESGVHPDKRGFGIGVAGFPEGHPTTPNRLDELEHTRAKVDEGADYICTQLFFDNRDFYDYRERCELAGIAAPIIAGIMPVTSLSSMKRMAQLALGARFPARLTRALQRCQDDPAAVRNVGIHWATEQCRDLLDNGVKGIHMYTLNKSDATRQIYQNLGLRDSMVVRKR